MFEFEGEDMGVDIGVDVDIGVAFVNTAVFEFVFRMFAFTFTLVSPQAVKPAAANASAIKDTVFLILVLSINSEIKDGSIDQPFSFPSVLCGKCRPLFWPSIGQEYLDEFGYYSPSEASCVCGGTQHRIFFKRIETFLYSAGHFTRIADISVVISRSHLCH
jgi:hypothetical protein